MSASPTCRCAEIYAVTQEARASRPSKRGVGGCRVANGEHGSRVANGERAFGVSNRGADALVAAHRHGQVGGRERLVARLLLVRRLGQHALGSTADATRGRCGFRSEKVVKRVVRHRHALARHPHGAAARVADRRHEHGFDVEEWNVAAALSCRQRAADLLHHADEAAVAAMQWPGVVAAITADLGRVVSGDAHERASQDRGRALVHGGAIIIWQ